MVQTRLPPHVAPYSSIPLDRRDAITELIGSAAELSAIRAGTSRDWPRAKRLGELLIEIEEWNLAWDLLSSFREMPPAASILADIALRHGLLFSASRLRGENPVPLEVGAYVPCFNGGAILADAVHSLSGQSYPVREIVVVDDGSTDGSGSLAQTLGVRVVAHSMNHGLAASRNTAVATLSSPWILGIDADVRLDPFWLERVVTSLHAHGAIGAGGRLIERYRASIGDAWRGRMQGQHHGPMAQLNVDLFGCNSLLSRDAVQRVGGFDEKYRTSFDDIAMSAALRAKGWTTTYDPLAIAYHVRQDDLRSILRSAYRWRLPPFEAKGVFEDLRLLGAKWLTETRASLTEIVELARGGEESVLIPSLLGIFVSPLLDLRELLSRRGESAELRDALSVAATWFITVARSLELPAKLQDVIVEEILEIWRDCIDGKDQREELRARNSIVSTFLAVFEGLGDGMRFEPGVREAITRGCEHLHSHPTVVSVPRSSWELRASLTQLLCWEGSRPALLVRPGEEETAARFAIQAYLYGLGDTVRCIGERAVLSGLPRWAAPAFEMSDGDEIQSYSNPVL